MGWDSEHIHAWVVHTGVKMMVEGEVIDEEDGDYVIEVPFCAWMCRCGAYKWRLSPEVHYREGYVEI